MGYGFLIVFHSIECKISRRHSWYSEKVSSLTYFEEWATPKKWAYEWAYISPQPTHLSARTKTHSFIATAAHVIHLRFHLHRGDGPTILIAVRLFREARGACSPIPSPATLFFKCLSSWPPSSEIRTARAKFIDFLIFCFQPLTLALKHA